MIAHISGTVTHRDLQTVTIDVGGVGYEILATPRTLATCQEGDEATIITQLITREDSQTLYGFTTRDERDVFNVLISSPGIGPKVALAVLSILTPDELRLALSQEDESALTQVPGIGPKTAKQMIVNIGNKLGEPDEVPASALPNVSGGKPSHKIVEALENLGWNTSQAKKAVSASQADQPDATEEDLLRLSLQYLGGHRG